MEEEQPVQCVIQQPEASRQTNILLFMLLLLFLCMIALAVALCRMERVERTLDTMTVLMHRAPQVAPAPVLSGGTYYTRRYYQPRYY